VHRTRTVIITVIVTLAVVFGIAMVFRGKVDPSKEAAAVHIEKVQQGELVEYVTAPGQVQPKKKVTISAKVSARITELPHKKGETVTAGDPNAQPPIPASVLVRLDSKDLESQLRSTEAAMAAQAAQVEVEKSRIAAQKATVLGNAATLKQAQQDLERKKGLFESKDISQSTFDLSQCKYDEVKAQYESGQHTLKSAELNLVVMQHTLEAADARVEQAKEALTYTTITSPMDGVVTRVNAEVGEVVIFGTMNNPGTVIMEVADLSKMLLMAQVDEIDIGKIKVGQKASVRVQAFNKQEFKGTVDSIALTNKTSQTGGKYFEAEILLENNGVQLYSGLTADVDIEAQRHADVLKVPSQAVLGRPIDDLPQDIRDKLPETEKSKTYIPVVFRYADGKTVITPVKTSASDLTHTIILSGLAEGDSIVTGPYKVLESVKHDQKLRDEREAKSKEAADANKAVDANKTVVDTNKADNGGKK
jgi:HlyD family secretion protein